jgi:hypothetical protein
MVLQWANEMVTRWVSAVTGDRRVIITVILNNCRSVAVGADVVGAVGVGRQGRLHKLRILHDDGFVYINQWGGWWRSRKNAWCWLRERCNLVK